MVVTFGTVTSCTCNHWSMVCYITLFLRVFSPVLNSCTSCTHILSWKYDSILISFCCFSEYIKLRYVFFFFFFHFFFFFFFFFHLGRVKRICVFEHSVMTNINCACLAIHRGQGSGFLSEGSSWLTACMSEQQRFWRDCADAQARLNLRCSHRR